MYGAPAAPAGAGLGMRADAGSRSGRSVFSEGKIFLGGLNYATTQASLTAYCQQWCARLAHAALRQTRNCHRRLCTLLPAGALHFSRDRVVRDQRLARPGGPPGAATVHCRGPVKDACVMAGKGYGFVTFEDIAAGFAFLEVRRTTPPGPLPAT